jgi:hypothetical protein
MIDEVGAIDANYIWTASANAPCKIRFDVVDDPDAGTQTLRYYAESPYAGRIRLGLYNGAALIEQWEQLLTTASALYEHELTETVGDWSALDLWLTAF